MREDAKPISRTIAGARCRQQQVVGQHHHVRNIKRNFRPPMCISAPFIPRSFPSPRRGATSGLAPNSHHHSNGGAKPCPTIASQQLTKPCISVPYLAFLVFRSRSHLRNYIPHLLLSHFQNALREFQLHIARPRPRNAAGLSPSRPRPPRPGKAARTKTIQR